MKNYKLSEELINEIITYLSKRPYVEVFRLIGQLQQAEKITEGKEDVGTKKKV